MDRIAALETRVDSIDARPGRIEGDVSSIKTTLASMDAKMDISGIRSDVEKAHADTYKWIVTIIAMAAARLRPPGKPNTDSSNAHEKSGGPLRELRIFRTLSC